MASRREPITVEIDGQSYQIGGIAPRKAFHVFRKCLPFLGALGPLIKQLFGEKVFGEVMGKAAAEAGSTTEEVAGAMVGADGVPLPELPPAKELVDMAVQAGEAIAKAVAEMSELDADFVLDNLLAGAKLVMPGGGAVPLVENGRLKAVDLPWMTQLGLAKESAVFNYSDFFDGLPSDLKGTARSAIARSLG